GRDDRVRPRALRSWLARALRSAGCTGLLGCRRTGSLLGLLQGVPGIGPFPGEFSELCVGISNAELLRALVPVARLLGIGLDPLCADFLDEGRIIAGAEKQCGLAAAGLDRALEIGARASEIADLDHLLTVLDKILDAVALFGAQNQRGARVFRDVKPGRRACERRAICADKLDAHVGALGGALLQRDSQVAALVGRQAPFRRPLGPPLREGGALRDPAARDEASCREH